MPYSRVVGLQALGLLEGCGTWWVMAEQVVCLLILGGLPTSLRIYGYRTRILELRKLFHAVGLLTPARVDPRSFNMASPTSAIITSMVYRSFTLSFL